jgi:hypothetical protein
MDLDFTLEHVNDLSVVFQMKDGEVVAVPQRSKVEMHLSLPGLGTRVTRGI